MPPDGFRPVNGTSQVERDLYIVCVDDDPDFIKSLELFLPERIGAHGADGLPYQFLFFTDPAAALEILAELKSENELIAMVISDQQMPQMKGTAFLGLVKERCPDCVRVLLTGHAGLDSAIEAINDRLLDKYLTKPIHDEEDFTVTIQILLNGFQMQRTIGTQQRTIEELYRFSNSLSECESLGASVDRIVSFLRDRTPCRHAVVLLENGDGRCGEPGVDASVGSGLRVAFGASALARLASCPRVGVASTLVEVPGLEDAATLLASRLPDAPCFYAVLRNPERVLGLLVAGGTPVSPGTPADPLSCLAHVADTAAIAVQNQHHRAALDRAFAEARAQAGRLEIANRRLETLDKLKSDFLDFVSHELRTSLTAMSAVDLVEAGTSREEQSILLQAVQEGYRRLRSLVERGLDYIVRVAERETGEFEVIDIAEIVRDAAAATPGLDPARIVGAAYPGFPCPVLGSRNDLRVAVMTILGNAVKFSRPDSPVDLHVMIEEGTVVIAVRDRGVGLDPAILPELFRPFTIGSSLHHNRGSALSLAVAAAIAEAHGGEIRAESAGVGHGATFTLRLPLRGSPSRSRSAPRRQASQRA